MGPREKLLFWGAQMSDLQRQLTLSLTHIPPRPIERHVEKRDGVAMQGEIVGWQEKRL